MLKHHIVADGVNPITQHFHLVRQAATAGQQHVWKIYDAKRIKDGKVCNFVFSSSNINYFINNKKPSYCWEGQPFVAIFRTSNTYA